MERYNPKNIYDAYLYVYGSHDVTIEEYKHYIKLLDFHNKTSDARIYNMTQELDIASEIRIKIAAENEPVTLLESTMTRRQLFDIENIAWARGLNIEEIKTFIEKNGKEERIDLGPFMTNGMWLLDYSSAGANK